MNNDHSFLLGVDGGGTSCRVRLCDASGRTLGEGRAGSANVRLGVDQAYAAILAATDEALSVAGLDRSVLVRTRAGFGLAGAVDEARKNAVRQYRHPFAAVAVETDAHTACLGAHGGGNGAILILGTGSCGVFHQDGRFQNVGGWGFMISDQGSGAAGPEPGASGAAGP
ncbi:BadF/BadG/BcrA/BcrD ATPase family protein [Marinobacterium aestuariivivens]|uniref:BadF/BadG/BcrA/BcrD ATPase family protein n=1 Tax=Marinobacterium aestuariivivens TaxID=1698799 RepID=A0ABW2A702_9GAMM